MTEHGSLGERDRLAEALGGAEADALRDQLAGVGLVAIDVEQLAELERQAAAYRRMRQLVEEP